MPRNVRFLGSLGLLCLVAVASATQVSQCSSAKFDNLTDNVLIGNCDKPPCRLRKNTKIPLTLKFQPGSQVKNLKQTVNANLLGLEFPFIGVDGSDACDRIYEEDGKTQNNCNFQDGKTYIFKNTIDVLQIYPRVKTVVHWALTDPTTGKDALCFEVPAKITN
ncbi:NPC intracellular cholesterol transporter 2 homolog a [Cylas formicarius]|uniref:NPC intracellular cholesterol transporter 2 homolog a n=1 Tax=Cylas formicarius TaxID=197179 RepID=UPI0029585AF0|nr:NPC intracellular cholesterol transporter 2 homolog a [Cylas formicarius]